MKTAQRSLSHDEIVYPKDVPIMYISTCSTQAYKVR